MLNILFKDSTFKSIERLPQWLRTHLPWVQQIRMLRRVLGMTQTQLARRAAVDSRVIRKLESGNANPTLATLTKMAHGLECELHLRFVPRKPLAKIVRERAEMKAKQVVALARGTSAMEEQEPGLNILQFEEKKLTDEFVARVSKLLWDD